ncbi:MAG: cyclic nucleotide-binding domain-containing protein [Rhodospirillaceae bacterium]
MAPHKRVLDRKVLFPGDTLIREGDFGECAYYIQSGQVGIYKHSGQDETLITVLPGNSVVGEMALIDNERRSATVRCLETATVVTVSRNLFEQKLANVDPFLRALLEMFTQKIRRLNSDYCSLDNKLQWLLRQTGLPPLPAHSHRGKSTTAEPATTNKAEPATTASKLARAKEENAKARAAVSELTQEGISRFDRFKLELAMLYHPDCVKDRLDETLTRADVFREIWSVLDNMEHEDDASG